MKVIVDTEQNIAKTAAQYYVDLLTSKPDAVLGLATGSTPIPLYNELINQYQNGNISFKDVVSYNLDEYVGLEPTHDQSYMYFMMENLFNHVDMKPENIHVPSGLNTSDDDLASYDRAIALAGGIDLQLLGIGNNGHIAFDEPGTPFGSLTHIVELTNSTRQANSRFFGSIDAVPTHAVCMGIRSIMNAKNIILIALGENKAEALKNTVYGRITKKCPASILQLHPSVTIFADKEAAQLL